MAGDQILDDLPATLPADLRAFLDCTGDTAVIANGPVTWVEIPPNVRSMLGGAAHPTLQVTPGSASGTAVLRVGADKVSVNTAAAGGNARPGPRGRAGRGGAAVGRRPTSCRSAAGPPPRARRGGTGARWR